MKNASEKQWQNKSQTEFQIDNEKRKIMQLGYNEKKSVHSKVGENFVISRSEELGIEKKICHQ